MGPGPSAQHQENTSTYFVRLRYLRGSLARAFSSDRTFLVFLLFTPKAIGGTICRYPSTLPYETRVRRYMRSSRTTSLFHILISNLAFRHLPSYGIAGH